MREISTNEQKIILVEMLKYIDNICRENDIKYTLIGGSLIGAIRHKGIIPWDDDIDIGLLPKEYNKLLKVINESKCDDYKILDISSEPTYYYPYAKLISTKTTGFEIGCKNINNYGVYIDIFKYNSIPDNENDAKKYYKKMMKLKEMLGNSYVNASNKIVNNMIRKVLSLLNSKKIAEKYIEHTEKYNSYNTNNVMINWSPYGQIKETHNRSSFQKYIDVPFENITAMIIEDYDKVLSTTFGDYMTPPPVEKQITHHSMKMYWKEENEK